MKKFLPFLLVIGLVGSPSLLWAGTWQEVGATYNSGTVYSIGEKTESGKVYRGISKITPTVSDVSKTLVRTGGVLAVELAIKGLLGAVDYVMDPANSQVIYFPKVNQTANLNNCSAYHKHQTFQGNLKQVGHTWCQAIRDYDNPADTFRQWSHIQYIVGCKGGAGSTVVHCNQAEKSIHYNDVAQKILDNALADQEEAVDYIFDVAETAVPLERQILDWENTKVVYDPLLKDPGKVSHTEIETAWGQEKHKYNQYPEKEARCKWLKDNQHRFLADKVKETEKAWGCRHSRASKDKKDKKR